MSYNFRIPIKKELFGNLNDIYETFNTFYEFKKTRLYKFIK